VTRITADWVLPVSSDPIRDGMLDIDSGRIVAVGKADDGPATPLGRVAILPGLVNAHTHTELSYLEGRIPPAERFLDWVRPMLAARGQRVDPADPAIVQATTTAIQAARASGTILMGDVSNTLVPARLFQGSGVSAHIFHELIGFSGRGVGDQVSAARRAIDEIASDGSLRLSLAPHAPYSVSPALFSAIRRDRDEHRMQPTTVHLGESREEVEFLRSGGGPWRTLLEELRVWNPDWRAPGTSPVGYLDRLGFLDQSVLIVHGVQCQFDELTRLRSCGVTMVSCPRSNVHVGVGSPPLQSFYDSGVEVAFGTDSLASVRDLNMFGELAEARRIAPEVAARSLLRSATLVGARALGYEHDLGSIEPGKRAALAVVRLPEHVADVEEYLVSGVEPRQVSWLEETLNA